MVRINTAVENSQSARKKRLGVTWPAVLERGLRGYEQDRRDREAAKKEERKHNVQIHQFLASPR